LKKCKNFENVGIQSEFSPKNPEIQTKMWPNEEHPGNPGFQRSRQKCGKETGI